MLHAVRFINTSSLISGTAYPGMSRGPSSNQETASAGQSETRQPTANQVAASNRNLISSRFGFLSCITGFTSICLLGLTLASLTPDRISRSPHQQPYVNRICQQVGGRSVGASGADHCQIDILLKLLAFIFTFGASVEIQLRRRKNVLLGCAYNSTLSAKLSDVLLLLLTGSSCFSLLALFNFVRDIFHNGQSTIGDEMSSSSGASVKKQDLKLVYLSLLFILTLFNLLTTFIYCSKSRHFLTPISVNLDSKQFQDPPPDYDEVMANEKLFPIEQSTLTGTALNGNHIHKSTL